MLSCLVCASSGVGGLVSREPEAAGGSVLPSGANGLQARQEARDFRRRLRGLVSCQKVSAQDAVCLSSDGRKSERAASLSSEAAGLLRDFFKHSSKALVFKNSLRLLGNEHIPVPGPFEPFPIFSLDFVNCGKSGDSDITLRFRLALCWTEDFSRYRVLCKVQLAEPGLGRNPGKMRNFLSPSVPSAAVSEIAVNIKCYKSVWGLSLDTYQLHLRYILLDSVTGYRSQYHLLSTLISSIRQIFRQCAYL